MYPIGPVQLTSIALTALLLAGCGGGNTAQPEPLPIREDGAYATPEPTPSPSRPVDTAAPDRATPSSPLPPATN